MSNPWAGRHPGTQHFEALFAFSHLPEHLQAISMPVAVIAAKMVGELPDGPELTAGLRKLVEAKDCFVRAAVAAPKAAGWSPGQAGATSEPFRAQGA
jgi:hypothetical protein